MSFFILRRRHSPLSLSLLLALVVSPPPSTASADEPARTFSGETNVVQVEIPVEVERRGQPVTGLRAEDFRVFAGGREVPLVGFEEVDLTVAGDSNAPSRAAAVVPAARRHLMLLFDVAANQPTRLAEGARAARDLVTGGLAPSDRVAVGVYLPQGQLTVILPFTSDHALAARSLAALASSLTDELDEEADAAMAGMAGALASVGADAATLRLQYLRAEERNVAGETLAELVPGGRGGFLMANSINHQRIVHEPSVRARRESNALSMVDGLRQLAEALRPITGRRYLTLFSEGFDANLLAPDLAVGIADPVGGSGRLLDGMTRTFAAMQRDGWILHTVDLAGTKRDSLGSDSLVYLAHEMHGETVLATNDLAGGMAKALDKSARSYLLTVQVGVQLDGAFHPLRVELREGRRGVALRHRTGFHVPQPFVGLDQAQLYVEALSMIADWDDRDDLGIGVSVLPTRRGASSTRVSVLIEVPGERLELSEPNAGLDVFGYAFDGQSVSRDSFAYSVELDPELTADRVAAAGVRVLADLDLAPGNYQLRLVVRDSASGGLSLRAVPLLLDATGAGADHVAFYFLAGEPDPWIRVPAQASAFQTAGLSLEPALRTTLAAGGQAKLVLLGQGLTGGQLTARIVDHEGTPVAGGSVEILALAAGEGGEPDLGVAQLNTGALRQGTYVLELVAGDDGKVMDRRWFTVAGTGV